MSNTYETQLLFGLEIECEYNPNKISPRVGSYHNPVKQNKYWFAETDGSLSASRDGWRTMELTSKPFTLADLPKVMKSLRQTVFKGKTMDEVMHINDTCGNHIHVSMFQKEEGNPATFTVHHAGKAFKFDGMPRTLTLTARKMKAIRKEVLALLPAPAQERYFRTYAKKTTRSKINNGDRYNEWNYINGYRAEFRSFNLLGVTDWATFVAKYEGVFAVLEQHLVNTGWKSETVSQTVDV